MGHKLTIHKTKDIFKVCQALKEYMKVTNYRHINGIPSLTWKKEIIHLDNLNEQTETGLEPRELTAIHICPMCFRKYA